MKRLIYMGLALFCASLTFGAVTAHAQEARKVNPKQEAMAKQRAEAAEKALATARAKGMEMAPAMIAGQKLYCNLKDARFVIKGKSEVNGKSSATEFVEVACENNLGYVIGERKDGQFVTYDCIETSARTAAPAGGRGGGGGNPLRCSLPANSKPYLGLQAQLAATGSHCIINKGTYVGATDTASVYELGCQDADGLRFTVATPRSATSASKAVPCYVLMQANTFCTLTRPEQSSTFIAALAQKAPKPCAATASRLVGQTKAGDSFYEFACPDGSGFLVQANASGAFMRDITCDEAKPLGGCTLTGATATAAAPPAAGGTPSAF